MQRRLRNCSKRNRKNQEEKFPRGQVDKLFLEGGFGRRRIAAVASRADLKRQVPRFDGP